MRLTITLSGLALGALLIAGCQEAHDTPAPPNENGGIENRRVGSDIPGATKSVSPGGTVHTASGGTNNQDTGADPTGKGPATAGTGAQPGGPHDIAAPKDAAAH